MTKTTVLLATTAASFGISALVGIWLVPYLRRLKYGQTILEIGPNWHKNKQGTPTMGGIMFILSVILSVLAGFVLASNTRLLGAQGFDRLLNTRLFGGLAMALGFSLIGFGDDFVKVTKKQNLGFTAMQKLIFQFGVSVVYLWSLYCAGDSSTTVFIPFFGQLDLGVAYWVLCSVGIVYIVNSVNLTDGLDGLASSVTIVCSLGFLVVAWLLGFFQTALYCAAIAGGLVGFLIYNAYPAKVFMGDTGSMFLGGSVVAMAFGVGLPLFLAFLGIIYIIESLSVVIQVLYFKKTGGKRFFKMTPIHHHFELSGYSEMQIVLLFSLVTAVGAALAVLAVRFL